MKDSVKQVAILHLTIVAPQVFNVTNLTRLNLKKDIKKAPRKGAFFYNI